MNLKYNYMSKITARTHFSQDTGENYPDYILDLLKDAEALKFENNNQAAIKILEEVLCEEPSCLLAYEEIADNYLILNEEEKSKKAADYALSISKESYIANYVLGFISLKKEDWSKALQYLQKADEIYHNNPEILRCLGWALFKVGKCTKGLIILERVLTMMPEDPITLCDLGVCYFELKYFDKALDLFARAVEVDPKNKRAQEMIKVAESVVAKLR